MRKEEREFLEANFQAIRAEMKADRDITNVKLDEIIVHQETTNGRVTDLEKQTWFFRMLHRNPKASIAIGVILFLGVVFILENDLFKIFKFW